MVDTVNDYTHLTDTENERETLVSKANIRGSECAMNAFKLFENMPYNEAMQLIREAMEELDFFLGSYDDMGLNLRDSVGTAQANFTEVFDIPVAGASASAPTNDFSKMFLTLSFRGISSILPLLLLTNTSLGGTSGSSSLGSLLPLLLISGGGFGGGQQQTIDPATGLPVPNQSSNNIQQILPLLLLTNNNSATSGSNNNNLLLIMLLSFMQQRPTQQTGFSTGSLVG
uniref:Uncharacterized protein n=1 Tax=Ciona savignyi TaxID=51511 RepID=H2Z498_CIOSA